jgi:phosphohistidine phosphatase
MKTLLILRHAKAENATPGLPDLDRALNDRGKGEALAVGGFMRKQNLKIDLVLSSPAQRARETAQLVLDTAGLQIDVRFYPQIYEASPQLLLALLSEAEEATSSLMLVGHNPGLEDLIRTLTGREAHMSPATLAKIDFEVAHWSEVKENTGTLAWLVNPAEAGA